MSLTFSYLADAGAFYSSVIRETGGVIAAPFNSQAFGNVNYLKNADGDFFAVTFDGSSFTFTPLVVISPTNGIVVSDTEVMFFQDNGDGTGNVATSSDGTSFVETGYTTDAVNPLFIFFISDGVVFCADDQGYTCSGGGGVSEFLLDGQAVPNGDQLDYIYVGTVAGIGACFFTYESSGANYLVKFFAHTGGEFTTPELADLPAVDNAGFWSFFLFNDVFYALQYTPSGAVNALYSSVDGVTWTLETADIFGAVRSYVSMFYFNAQDNIMAGFGETSGPVEQTTVYATTVPVPVSPTSGNQGITGGGINGQGGAVGFSGVSASNSSGISLASLAYPAGIVPRGVNDFGIDLGL